MATKIDGLVLNKANSSGVSKSGNPWMKQSVLIQTLEQYPKQVLIEVFGENKVREFNIAIGEHIRFSLNIESVCNERGYWNTTIRAWAVERIQLQPAAAPMPNGMPVQTAPMAPAPSAQMPAPAHSAQMPAPAPMPQVQMPMPQVQMPMPQVQMPMPQVQMPMQMPAQQTAPMAQQAGQMQGQMQAAPIAGFPNGGGAGVNTPTGFTDRLPF